MKTRNPISKLWKLTLAAALLFALAPAPRPAMATGSPCPKICGYTFNPIDGCCEAGPQYDCYDFCITNS